MDNKTEFPNVKKHRHLTKIRCLFISEKGAPAVEFSGLKQALYEAEIVTAQAVEGEIADLRSQIKMKEDHDDKYRGLDKNSVRVANGVRGDKDFGLDSPLYGAMGFVRASGLTRKTKTPSGE